MDKLLVLPTLALAALFTLASGACTTVGSSEAVTYDGISDGMDSLPDCSPDSQGSLFWVKEKSKAFECNKPNQWSERKNARKPDDADTDEKSGDSADAISPRIVK